MDFIYLMIVVVLKVFTLDTQEKLTEHIAQQNFMVIKEEWKLWEMVM